MPFVSKSLKAWLPSQTSLYLITPSCMPAMFTAMDTLSTIQNNDTWVLEMSGASIHITSLLTFRNLQGIYKSLIKDVTRDTDKSKSKTWEKNSCTSPVYTTTRANQNQQIPWKEDMCYSYSTDYSS